MLKKASLLSSETRLSCRDFEDSQRGGAIVLSYVLI